MPLPSLSSKSMVRQRIEQYVMEPMKLIAYVLLWGLTTAYLTLWLIIFLETIISHFSSIWTTSFSTSIDHFWSTRLSLALSSVVILCWANAYTIKQTRQAYQDLRAWVVSTTLYKQLAWMIACVREIMSSLHISVVVQSVEISSESEIPATVEMQISEVLGPPVAGENHRTEVRPEDHLPVVLARPKAGLFGTVLSSCQIHVIGPTGMEKVVDLHYRSLLPLWLYLVIRAEDSDSVPIGDILWDVYGYRGLAEKTQTGQGEDPRDRLLRRFRSHCYSLRHEINEACAEVGLPKMELFHRERRNKTTYWRLSDEVHIEDLAHLKTCRTLLAGLEGISIDETKYRAEVKAACECISEDGAHLPDWFYVYKTKKKMRETTWCPKKPCWTDAEYSLLSQVEHRLKLMQPHASWYDPWLQQTIKEALYTYSDALQYLATQAHRDAEQTENEQARRRLWCREEYFWSTYALSCAHLQDEFPEEPLISAGELALQKALSCSLLLRDPVFDATYTYDDFKRLVGGWKPLAETVDLWQQALAPEEEEEYEDLPELFWGDRYAESRSRLKRWNAGS